MKTKHLDHQLTLSGEQRGLRKNGAASRGYAPPAPTALRAFARPYGPPHPAPQGLRPSRYALTHSRGPASGAELTAQNTLAMLMASNVSSTDGCSKIQLLRMDLPLATRCVLLQGPGRLLFSCWLRFRSGLTARVLLWSLYWLRRCFKRSIFRLLTWFICCALACRAFPVG